MTQATAHPDEATGVLDDPDAATQTSSDSTEAASESVPEAKGRINEARRYRKRAQAAETLVEQLQQELETQAVVLSEQRALTAELQQRQAINDHLIESRAVDIETARLLVDLSLKDMPEPDVTRAVSDLRRRKPFLFAQHGPGHGAMSPKDAEHPHGTRLDQAAAEACATGRRQDLLHYLRLRRRR